MNTPLPSADAAAASADREWILYKKLVELIHLDKFYKAPESARDKLKAAMNFSPSNKAIKASDVVLTVVHAGGRETLPISANGKIDMVPNPVWMAENPWIHTSLPHGEKARYALAVMAKLPDSLEFEYARLLGSIAQANALIKSQLGMLSFLAPKSTTVELKFAEPKQQTVRILAKAGVITYTADEKGEIKLKPDNALIQENPQIILSERPVSSDLI